MARLYVVTFFEVIIAAANGDHDLFNFTAATNKPIRIARLDLFNKSDYGDVNDEGVSIRIIRGNTTNGSGGATPTPIPFEPDDTTTPGFVARTCDTVIASAGTAQELYTAGFNVRSGMTEILPDLFRCATTATAGKLCVRLGNGTVGVADDMTMSGTALIMEGVV